MAMTRVALGTIIVVVLGVGGVLLYKVAGRSVPVPDRTDVWKPDNVVLLDSAQVGRSPKAYLFRYDTGAFGYSVKMVSVDEPSYKKAVIQSDHITGIRWAARDTLIVELDTADYELKGPRRGLTVVPRVHQGSD